MHLPVLHRRLLGIVLLSALALLTGLGVAPRALAYSRMPYFWLGGDITLRLQLGAPGTRLTDGSTSWNSVATLAAAEWTALSGRVRFRTETAEPPTLASTEKENLVNNVFFDTTIYGLAFDSRTLAVTVPNVVRNTVLEADVIVNANLPWNSYRGPLPILVSSIGYDLRRVLVHEFGHVLGLNHPDQAQPAQNVAAIMNSTISDTDTLQFDDRDGFQAIYAPSRSIVFDTQPVGAVKNLNELTTFSAAARSLNNLPVFYIWMFTRPGGQPERLELAEEPTYSLGGAQPADAGVYQVLAYTATSAALSAPAELVVTPPSTSPATRLANLSARGFVGADADVLISGFVIGGTGSKPVLIRAIGGATLAGFGVSGTVPDPHLTVYNSAGVIVAQNNNWNEGDAPAIRAAAARLGSFALPEGSTDAALLLNLPPGSYTAQVSSRSPATGVALVEVYEADADESAALPHKLGNLSTRGRIGPDGNILIAGLVVRGPRPRTFLIRAIGPTLNRFGVVTALIDPVLTLYDAAGTQLRYNDDWDTPVGNMRAFRFAADSVGGFGLVETRNVETRAGLDSVMIVTLPPGNYTAQVSGFGTATGVVLAEIYELSL